ncbi:hypothetical protein SB3_31775, partial [Methylobacterium radiotolerans]
MSRTPAADQATHGESLMKFIGIVLGAALSAMATAASADVVRHPIPNSTFPIAQAVTVTGNTTTVYVSGQV